MGTCSSKTKFADMAEKKPNFKNGWDNIYDEVRCSGHYGSEYYGNSSVPEPDVIEMFRKDQYIVKGKVYITYDQVIFGLIIRHLATIEDINERRIHGKVIIDLIRLYETLTIKIHGMCGSKVNRTFEQKKEEIAKFFIEHPWLTTIFRKSLTTHDYTCCGHYEDFLFMTWDTRNAVTDHIYEVCGFSRRI